MTVLLLEPLHPDARRELEAAGAVRESGGPVEALAIASTDPVAAIVTRAQQHVGGDLMDACASTLRVVARCGAGLDTIDLDAARSRGLAVVHSPGLNSEATAEHAIALALGMTHGLVALDRAVRAGDWSIRERRLGVELRGGVLGVLGLGAVGRRVAELGAALGMRVLYWSARSRDERFEYRPLDDLLRCADVVSLHVSLTDQTRGMIGSPQLAAMKPDAYLVNTARGGIVDEAAVAAALAAGDIAGYASDVLATEPPEPDNPLLTAPNTLLTPHSAALGEQIYRDVCLYCVRNMTALLDGGEPDRAALYLEPRARSVGKG